MINVSKEVPSVPLLNIFSIYFFSYIRHIIPVVMCPFWLERREKLAVIKIYSGEFLLLDLEVVRFVHDYTELHFI